MLFITERKVQILIKSWLGFLDNVWFNWIIIVLVLDLMMASIGDEPKDLEE